MHPRIYKEFERLFDIYPPSDDVLELGAPPQREGSLLPAVLSRDPSARCVGLNLRIPKRFDPTTVPFEMVQGNANDLSMFADQSFDSVVTNALLEHDRAFWRTLSEVRRVLRPGGTFYVGVPGFTSKASLGNRAMDLAGKSRLTKSWRVGSIYTRLTETRLMGTSTFRFHAAPHDYWRFSEQAVREVFLEGMDCLALSEVLTPVRIVAVGRARLAVEGDRGEASSTERL